MANKFGHLELFVKDPLSSKDFYENKLGFDLTVVQGDSAVWLRSGEIELLLRKGQRSDTGDKMEKTAFDIVLYTDNLSEEARRLKKAGVEIEAMPNENNCFSFRDPDGNWFQLVDSKDHQ